MAAKLHVVMIINFLVLFGITVEVADGICTWPIEFANTAWQDNSKGDITFTTDKLTGWALLITAAIPPQPYALWQCFSTSLYQSDSILIARTQGTFVAYNASFYGYICLKLKMITNVSYRYYVYNPENRGVDWERVQMTNSSTVTDLHALCLLDNNNAALRPSSSEYRVMIKTGSAAAARIDCPYVFLGSYDYIYTDQNGAVTCDNSADTWSTCQNSTEMKFNYLTCPAKVANSKSNAVWCVDTVPSGGNNYVTVYNGYDATSDIDNSYYFLFSCFAILGDGTIASVTPNQCRKDQEPDTAPAGGASLTMTRGSSSCVTCPALSAPARGSLSISTDGPVTTASYTCTANYTLTGSPTRVCQSNRTWSGTNPRCSCPTPVIPTNGNITLSSDGFTASFTCNLWFTLKGVSSLTCNAVTNTWLGTEPLCVSCPKLSNITSGNVTVSTNGIVTSAAYACDSNYTLVGSSVSKCTTTGAWNPLPASCVNSTASAAAAKEGGGNSGFLPAVIALAVIVAVLAVALGGILFYIKKIKNNVTDSGESSSKKSSELLSAMFPSSKAPLDHKRPNLDSQMTSLSLAGHNQTPAPSRVDTDTPRTPRTMKSVASIGNLQLDLVRETTSSVIFSNNPAPWSKKPTK